MKEEALKRREEDPTSLSQVAKGWGQPWVAPGKEREGAGSPQDLLPVLTEGAGDAAQPVPTPDPRQLLPGTLNFPCRRPPAHCVVPRCRSDVLMSVRRSRRQICNGDPVCSQLKYKPRVLCLNSDLTWVFCCCSRALPQQG